MRTILLLNDREDDALCAAIESMEAYAEELRADNDDRTADELDEYKDLLTHFLHSHSLRFMSV